MRAILKFGAGFARRLIKFDTSVHAGELNRLCTRNPFLQGVLVPSTFD